MSIVYYDGTKPTITISGVAEFRYDSLAIAIAETR